MFWEIFIFVFFFGGSIWAALEWTIRRTMKHRERMQELRNEELRLQLQLTQGNREGFNNSSFVPSQPSPKQASWEEQRQASSYETGYPQQSN